MVGLVVRVADVRELVEDARLHVRRVVRHEQATFDAALAEWGEAGLVDIIGCLGNFSMLAMPLNTFQVDLKPGDPEPFPGGAGSRKRRGRR